MTPINASTNDRNRTILIILGIFLLSVAVRVLTAEYIDIGGDNSEKWRQAHRLVEGLGYSVWYQQTVRWAIMLPLAGIIKAFGLNPVLAYIQPILFSSAAAVFIFLIGQRLHSRSLGLTAALATIIFPQMAQTGSQLWPGVFELGFLSLCVWLILVWLDTRSRTTLVLAALAFFLGWGSRVTMIYAAPGLALLIWLPGRNYKALFSFGAVVAALFLVEWAVFWQITGNPMGRIGIITGTHIQSAGLDITLTEYLLSFLKLSKLKGLVAVWVACLGGAVYVAARGDSRWRALALLYVIYTFLLLYMISGVSPLKLAMPVGTRFWGVVAPFGLLLLLRALFDLKEVRPRTAMALMGLVFAAFLGFTAKKIPPVNSLAQISRDYGLLAPILAERKPVLMRYEHWQPDFIEEHIIAAITGKRGTRVPREDHVLAAIHRNHARMIALFLPDVSQYDAYLEADTLTATDYTTYLFTPPGAAPDEPPAAEIIYGRKLHRAIALPR
ncbi:MAG: glycosyltransferase family 39 protein [Pseudodesulfovibrio sp.]|uniref:Uncharacterized protein n=1 Tax=Pseudodesulfovibrio aespoeensis (strain ATCC 700646 / DSM 10631 / Aspo-2) TaxID=643562 RepID=E6VR10_PSEA9|nr:MULTISPECIES: glycosyltransferase family 39 protein [Pseudodesulfovibrio]MBU4190723.1 glycosyltransferase family 39 protein [Pseudomonadota bacterium]ADU62990.1 hypothetical protein Daes_1981 [Pseudodesulfovibrio aespoeensis Aspo-2]MBU4242764.1 glycosyltransferase family 39 protein [Pseudomonadota bacterium]MBU4380229.1 glycosyltransferase family 39 protein [Pseudomonadota bacterium]MBU4475906.1 glycosyltransferase family 39 protein [Pseudomonadota bacterium]